MFVCHRTIFPTRKLVIPPNSFLFFLSLSSTGEKPLQLSDQRYLFYGAGEAGIGIADLLSSAIVNEQLQQGFQGDLEKAREQCWFVDSQGLITSERLKQKGKYGFSSVIAVVIVIVRFHRIATKQKRQLLLLTIIDCLFLCFTHIATAAHGDNCNRQSTIGRA